MDCVTDFCDVPVFVVMDCVTDLHRLCDRFTQIVWQIYTDCVTDLHSVFGVICLFVCLFDSDQRHFQQYYSFI